MHVLNSLPQVKWGNKGATEEGNKLEKAKVHQHYETIHLFCLGNLTNADHTNHLHNHLQDASVVKVERRAAAPPPRPPPPSHSHTSTSGCWGNTKVSQLLIGYRHKLW